MFKNYIFDLYGTLIDIRTDETKQELWDKMVYVYGYHGASYTSEELRDNYFRCVNEEFEKAVEKEYPEIQIDKVFARLLKEKGVTPRKTAVMYIARMFRCLSTEKLKLYEGVKELLSELKKRGKKVYLLSNAQALFTLPEITAMDLTKYFDDILISSEYLCMKPSEKFYKTLIDKYQLNVDECIMIGNDPSSDIQGALSVKMKSLYIHTAISPQDKQDIKADYLIMDGDFNKIMPLILKEM